METMTGHHDRGAAGDAVPPATGLDSIRQRLWHGETLCLRFGEGVGFDVWVEKFGNPPQVFFEGRALPLDELDAVMARIADYLSKGEVRVSWNAEIPTKRDRPGV
jgi:hypothetical protein